MKGYRVINLESSIQGHSKTYGTTFDHQSSGSYASSRSQRRADRLHQPMYHSYGKTWQGDNAFPITPVRSNRCVPKSILAEDFEVIDNTLLPISLSFLDSPCRDS